MEKYIIPFKDNLVIKVYGEGKSLFVYIYDTKLNEIVSESGLVYQIGDYSVGAGDIICGDFGCKSRSHFEKFEHKGKHSKV